METLEVKSYSTCEGFLRQHPAVTPFLDEDAAADLTNSHAYADNRR